MAYQEKIVHLDDLLLRRTLLGYLGQLTRPRVEQLAGWLGEALGWSGAETSEEVERCLKILVDRHSVSL